MQRIPIREAASGDDPVASGLAAVQLHPVPSKQALLVKVVTPSAPTSDVEHVPCDIVLVIDVSTSMNDDATVPGEAERTGLSVMDLTKHAALTILETLNEKDRLGIVTFGTRSTMVQSLTYMDRDRKDAARDKIKTLSPIGSTNLWHGIQNGIRVFDESLDNGNVRAMMVLTDGMPNHMCPQQGYIPKLKTMPPLPATLHTFGFGYGLRSGLLKSLAEFGHGNYAFIPDAGMIGTVFVHAVANLQATFATEASLTLSHSPSIQIRQVGETTVVQQLPQELAAEDADRIMALQIHLGNLQFGQSRDLFLRFESLRNEESSAATSAAEEAWSSITITLSYRKSNLDGPSVPAQPLSTSTQGSILQASKVADAEVAYHESRAEICQALSAMFPLGPDGEHRPGVAKCETYKSTLAELMAKLPAKDFDDEKNVSLMQDLNGPEPQGQISMAINNAAYFGKWGIHYLPSYTNAHSRQICNSFKDPGPLQYGTNSPLFISCRDRLNDAFDNLPPPEPSAKPYPSHAYRCSPATASHHAPVDMRRYRDAAGVCFAGSTPVELASGRVVHIRRLRRGTKVRTPTGVRKVALVLRTPVRDETLCRVGSLLVTPWHPISLEGKTWHFPAVRAHKTVRFTGSVYSVMLQRDGNSRSHAVRVAGIWGVTLGHGLTTGRDARAHCFLGDYNRVGRSLLQLGADKLGVVQGRGAVRHCTSGLVCGFKRRRGIDTEK
ncbi:hypothetical protein E4U41_003688 [Claviceps citrina]|nr:hypothetical protein E4U41_003688 [Claviceps citrina]